MYLFCINRYLFIYNDITNYDTVLARNKIELDLPGVAFVDVDLELDEGVDGDPFTMNKNENEKNRKIEIIGKNKDFINTHIINDDDISNINKSFDEDISNKNDTEKKIKIKIK